MSNKSKTYPVLYVQHSGRDSGVHLIAYDLNTTDVFLGTEKLTDILDALDELVEAGNQAVELMEGLNHER